MASLKGILSPEIDNSLHELDNQATINQPVPDVGWGDYAKSALSDAYLRNPTYSLLGKAVGYGSPNYSKSQLEMLYPDVPPEHWKGDANAFQAELLYDRYKHEEEKKALADLVSGISDPNSGWKESFAADTIGGVAGLAAGLMDPLLLTTFMATGAGVAAAGIKTAKIAPAFAAAIANSRIMAPVSYEIAQNLLAETAVSYPLNRFVLNEYDQEDRTLKDSVTNAIGGAVAFSALKYGGQKVFGPVFRSGGEFIDRMREGSFSKMKDKVNSHLNSETANKVAFEDAASHTATSPMGEPPSSVTERLSKRAFEKGNTADFDTSRSPFYGVYDEASGKADYAGERFGDTHVFVSSPEAAQGMFDMYAKDGNIYSVYGHKGELNLIDLEAVKANDLPDVLDQVEAEVGRGIWSKLDDKSTMADVFRAVNDMAEAEGASGADITAMFDAINQRLQDEGFQGTTHFEQQGNTRHTVMSVFDKAMNAEHLEQLQKGTSKKPSTPVSEENFNARTDGDIVSLDGQKIAITEPLPYDSFYDEDVDFKRELDRYNDPEYLREVQESTSKYYTSTEIEKLVDENINVIMADLRESQRQAAERFHGSSSEVNSLTDMGTNGWFSDKNVYGGGFYTTDNVEIGKKYTKKGKGTTPSLYKVKELGEVKAFNLDEAMPEDVRSTLAEIADSFDYTQDGYLHDIMSENSSLGRALDKMRKESKAIGLTTDTFQEMVMTMQDELKLMGYGAFDHEGGNLTGGQKHNVRIYWEPSTQIEIDPAVDPYVKLEERVKQIKEELKKNPPEKEGEFIKAMENCLRKNA